MAHSNTAGGEATLPALMRSYVPVNGAFANCLWKNNTAYSSGEAMYLDASRKGAFDHSWQDNSANDDGVALYNQTVSSCASNYAQATVEAGRRCTNPSLSGSSVGSFAGGRGDILSLVPVMSAAWSQRSVGADSDAQEPGIAMKVVKTALGVRELEDDIVTKNPLSDNIEM